MNKPTNIEIAGMLERIAEILEVEDANPFRVRAYRDAAISLHYAKQDVAELIHANKLDDVKDLPHIGDGITAVISEYVKTGQSNLLRDLEAQAGPEAALVQVPGIGKEFAERIVEQIHVKTLPDLEAAAHDGRLETVEGFGKRRVEGIRQALAGMLNHAPRRQTTAKPDSPSSPDNKDQPSVKLLLEIDEEYRRRAKANDLQKIAPKRFNPDDKAWLPVMYVQREDWAFTALFSNTARAHELEKTNDWVVIYYERNSQEQQNTVVTETQGVLEGKRVVRGRNAESRQHYSVTTD